MRTSKARQSRIAGVLAGALLLSASAAANGLQGWEPVSNEDGIVVYQKTESTSDVISLRGEADLEATVEHVAEVIKDSAAAPEWMPLVAGKKDLKSLGPFERIESTHVAMPWPIADRYFINRGKAEVLPGGGVRLSVTGVEHPDTAWLEDDKVLGTLHYSEFVLTPTAAGGTHVALEINSDPAGLIPSWMVNMAQRSWPRDFFRGLTAQLAKRGWLHNPALAH